MMKSTLQIFIKIIKLTTYRETNIMLSDWVLNTMMNLIGNYFLNVPDKSDELFYHNLQLFHRLLRCYVTPEKTLSEREILKIFISALNFSAKVIITDTARHNLGLYCSIVQSWIEWFQPKEEDLSYLWKDLNREQEFRDLMLLDFDCRFLCNQEAIKDFTIAIDAYNQKKVQPDTTDPDQKSLIEDIFVHLSALTKCPLTDEERNALLESANESDPTIERLYSLHVNSSSEDYQEVSPPNTAIKRLKL